MVENGSLTAKKRNKKRRFYNEKQANPKSSMLRQWRARREAIGQRLELVEGTSPRAIKSSRCASSELFFSCCGSVAAPPALANCKEHEVKTDIS
jgi:hypothetical protein